MRRYAIIISVEEYKHFLSTPFTHADSNLIYSTLTELCDYPIQHSLLLKLSPDADKKPADILAEIRKTVEGSEPGDSVLFYFAGHGHYTDGRSYLILPNTVSDAYENTALPLDDVSKELRSPQRSCFRIFDSCHSGLDVRDGGNKPDSESFVRAITHDATGWVTLAACREDQYSLSDVTIGHGIFTYYFCEYIRSRNAGENVLPELLKVGIVDKILEHSKRIGPTQTPTLNASISGNISLAVRRAAGVKNELSPSSGGKNKDLLTRIGMLREIKDISNKFDLEKVLSVLKESIESALKQHNELAFSISGGPQIIIDVIPDKMKSAIVNFSQRQGLQPRHILESYEVEYEPSPMAAGFGVYTIRNRKSVNYRVRQPKELPKSASIVEIHGDKRCVPEAKILVYVIPLQLTLCLLVSAFHHDWPPNEDGLKLILQSHKIIQPVSSLEEIKDFAELAGEEIVRELQQHVAKRVEMLEQELKR